MAGVKIAGPLDPRWSDGYAVSAEHIRGGRRSTPTLALVDTAVPLAHRVAGMAIVDESTRIEYVLAEDLTTLLSTHTDATLTDQGTTLTATVSRVSALETEVRSGRLGAATWAALATWPILPTAGGYPIGTVVEIPGDSGTHTDPVVGGTVSNSGVFAAASGGWQRIGNATTAATEAAITALQSGLSAETARAGAAELVAMKAAAASRAPASRFHRSDDEVLSVGVDSAGAAIVRYDEYGNPLLGVLTLFERGDDLANKILIVDDDWNYAVLSGGGSAETAVPEMEIVVTTDLIDIYILQFGTTYIQWRIQHQTYAARKAEVWRTVGVWEAERVSSGLYTQGQKIFFNGEVETAIALVGRVELIGGITHGGEKLTSFRMHVDGVEKDHTSSAVYQCSRLDLFQSAELYRPGPDGGANWPDDPPVKIADGFKRWTFTPKDCLLLTQHVDHLVGGFAIDHGYFGMIPACRVESSVQVTDSGARSPRYATEDVAGDSFTEVYTDSSDVMLWGDRYSVETASTYRTGATPLVTYIRPHPSGNKVYISCFEGDIPAAGDSWDVANTIRVTVRS